MQQVTEIPLGSLKAYGNLSGYIYIHIPKYIAKHFNITPYTYFSIVYRDSRVVIEQKKEK